MEFYDNDDLELYQNINTGDSISLMFYYLIFLFFMKWYFNLELN